MANKNKPRREALTSKAKGQAFAERKRRNRKRRKAIVQLMLSSKSGG